MEFTKERLPRERFFVTKVKTFVSESRGHHWRHIVYQNDLRRQRLQRIETLEIERIKKRKNMPLEILRNEDRYGVGRGRQAQTVNVDNVIAQLSDALETDNPLEMANSLNGTFVQVVRGEDFQGSVSGASKALKEWANENRIIASFRKADDGLTKTHLKFTLRVDGDIATMGDVDVIDEDEDES